MQYWSLTHADGLVSYGHGGVPPAGAVEIDADAFATGSAHVTPLPVNRCSKLGLKRALAETGADAVFLKPEWPDVKAVIEADPDLKEDWDLAVDIVRTDPVVKAMIAARKYDDATVSKILARANVLAA